MTPIVISAADSWPKKILVDLSSERFDVGIQALRQIDEFYRKSVWGKLAWILFIAFFVRWSGMSRPLRIRFVVIAALLAIVILPPLSAFAVDRGFGIPGTELDESIRELLQRIDFRLGLNFSARPAVTFSRVRPRYFAGVNYRLRSGTYNVDQPEVTIEANSILTVDPGTSLVMGPGVHILVLGTLTAKGSDDEEGHISFAARDPSRPWANISFCDDKSAASVLSYCTIENGSGIQAVGSDTGTFNLTKDGGRVGGGILLFDTSVTLRHVRIRRCSAYYGGGAYIRNRVRERGVPEPRGPYFEDVLFDECSAVGTDLSAGGGVWVQRAYPEFKDCHFERNKALGKIGCGGGAYFGVMARGRILKTTFANNEAGAEGGGLYASESMNRFQLDERCGIVIRECEFTENRSHGSGGGVSLSNCRVKIDRCVFRKNSALGYVYKGATHEKANGGGLYMEFLKSYDCDPDKSVELTDSRFEGNEVVPEAVSSARDYSGGGVCIVANGVVPLVMSALVFIGNRSPLVAGNPTIGCQIATSHPSAFPGWDGKWDARTIFDNPSSGIEAIAILSNGLPFDPETRMGFETLDALLERSRSRLQAPEDATAVLGDLQIRADRRLPENTFNDRPVDSKISAIVVHYTSAINVLPGNPYDLDAILGIFTGVTAPNEPLTSSHYLIDRDGTTLRLVDEVRRAWHAGYSRMPSGEEDVNSFSIGIEIVCMPKDQFTDRQYESLGQLIAILRRKYPDITSERVVGHDQIRALWNLKHPDRKAAEKTDPGPLFHWSRVIAGFQSRSK